MTNVPDVSIGVNCFLQPMIFSVVQKQNINGYVQEIITPYSTLGAKQPFSPKQLEIKPEGQRSWAWYKIHTSPDLDLEDDSVFILGGIRYRVMQKTRYKEYGYNEYDCREDYQSNLPESGDFPSPY